MNSRGWWRLLRGKGIQILVVLLATRSCLLQMYSSLSFTSLPAGGALILPVLAPSPIVLYHYLACDLR